MLKNEGIVPPVVPPMLFKFGYNLLQVATITIIIRRDKIKSDGTAPLNFLIIKHRVKTKISSGVYVQPKYWDEKHLRVKPGMINSARINNFLQSKLAEIQQSVLNDETVNKSISSKQLKRNVFGYEPQNFFPFAESDNQEYLNDGKIATFKLQNSVINKLKEYTKKNTLYFQEVNNEFLSGFEKFLQSKKENKTNTIFKNLDYIRKVFKKAVKKKIIEPQDNPFLDVKLKKQKTNRDYLSEEEISKIEQLSIPKGTRMEMHRDMFIFSSYAGGLRVSDVLLLKWSQFDGTHLNLQIHKTKSQLSIKLPSKAIEIMERYKPVEMSFQKRVFPLVVDNLDMSNPTEVHTAISNGTAYINKNLKIIARKAGIEKNLSFHVSRHTWATRALRKGISIDKVSKLMGHAQIRETQIYAKIVSEELDKAMDVFND